MAGGIIVADGTYKLDNKGHPVLVIGTVDLGQHFKTVAVCLSNSEDAVAYAQAFNAIKAAAQLTK